MKIIILAGYSKSLINFRKELLISMIQRGHDVIAVGPENDYKEELNKINVKFIQLKFNRLGINPISDLKLVIQLRNLLRKERPDLFFGYTIKPVIYGSIAAWLSKVKRIFVMITGLGTIFIEGNSKKKYIKIIVKNLYRVGFMCATSVFFHNKDDMNEFVEMRLLDRKKCHIVNGSGVNLDYYSPSPLSQDNIFLFCGSVTGDKGVREYIKASRILHERHSDIRCWILGRLNNRLTGIPEEEIQHYVKEGIIEYLGSTEDVRPYLDRCRFYVLPSYREGTPRSVLEAMAKGRPIITTDAPGCRDTVVDGLNGFLVPIKNHNILAEKMLWMIEHPSEVELMAKKSLELVRQKYDVNNINRGMLSLFGL